MLRDPKTGRETLYGRAAGRERTSVVLQHPQNRSKGRTAAGEVVAAADSGFSATKKFRPPFLPCFGRKPLAPSSFHACDQTLVLVVHMLENCCTASAWQKKKKHAHTHTLAHARTLAHIHTPLYRTCVCSQAFVPRELSVQEVLFVAGRARPEEPFCSPDLMAAWVAHLLKRNSLFRQHTTVLRINLPGPGVIKYDFTRLSSDTQLNLCLLVGRHIAPFQIPTAKLI